MCTGLVERKHGDESLYQLAKAAHKAIAKLPYDDWLSDPLHTLQFCVKSDESGQARDD